VTHYEVLGVSPTSSADSIRRAYLALARQYHPDFHTNDSPATRADAQREMQRLNEAWRVLGDPATREQYDLVALDPPVAARQASPDPSAGWRPGSGTAHPDFVPYGDDDDFEADEAREAYLDSLDDTPFARARQVPQWQQVLPVVLLLTALASLCIGLVVSLTPLLGLGVILLVLSGLAFVLTPMLAVMRSYDPDPD
jgi:curved DNA-binding protein CbpA